MRPETRRTRQVPQEPPLQLWGRLRCWRSAAVSTGSSPRASKCRLDGRTWTFTRPLSGKRKKAPHLSMRGRIPAKTLRSHGQQEVVVHEFGHGPPLIACRHVGEAEVDSVVNAHIHHLLCRRGKAAVEADLLD